MDTSNVSRDKHCQACLQQSSHQMYSLTSNNFTFDGVEQTLADIYYQCTQLVAETEQFNSRFGWVCLSCFEKLIDFFQFRKMCIDSFNTLKETKLPTSAFKVEMVDICEDMAIYTEPYDDNVKNDEDSFNHEYEISIDKMDYNPTDDFSLEIQKVEPVDDLAKVKGCDKHNTTMSVDENIIRERPSSEDEDEDRDDDVEDQEDREDDEDEEDEEVKKDTTIDQDNVKTQNQHSKSGCNNKVKHGITNSNTLVTAIKEIKIDKKGIRATARMYNIPRSSLCRYINKLDETIPDVAAVEDAELLKMVRKIASTKPSINLKRNLPEPKYACEVCPARFFKKLRYDAHKRKHLGLSQYKCQYCEKGYEKSFTLRMHIAAKHADSAEKPVFICDIGGCGKSYSAKDSLLTHMKRIHFGEKLERQTGARKICEQCGKTFKDNVALVTHSYSHSKVTPFKCHICSKMLTTSKSLKVHLMRHDGIKNFVCPICGLRKITGHELRMHMKYHADLQFPCELCSSVFTRAENMKRHMKVVHCGVKAYPCTHCDRSFGKAETLKHHIMTHTGEKPLACSVCDKRFIQPVALKRHLKVHSKIK